MSERVVIKTPKDEKKVNEYYIKIAGLLRVLKYAVLLVLVLFVVVMMLIFRDSITYENLQYMLRDLNVASSGFSFSSVDFAFGNATDAELFKGDMLVAGKKNIALYSMSGKKVFSQSVNYVDPQIATSDKYFLVYDLDGMSYSIYNSYSKLHSDSLDYAITDAVVGNNGSYAVVTSTREYPYAVYLYNKDFKRIGEYYKNKYVIDLALSDDGGQLILLSFYVVNGDYITEISVCDTSGEMENKDIVLSGYFPLSVSYCENGGFTVITDGGAFCYSADGSYIKNVSVSGETLSGYSFGDRMSALFFKKNENVSETSVVLFDMEGNILYNNYVYGKIIDTAVSGDTVYVLFDSSVICIDAKTGESRSAKCNEGGISLLVPDNSDGSRAVVCYKSSAVTVKFE